MNSANANSVTNAGNAGNAARAAMLIRGAMTVDVGVLGVGRVDVVGIERVDARCLARVVLRLVLSAWCSALEVQRLRLSA